MTTGQHPDHLLRGLRDRGPVRLHADRVDHGVGAPAGGEVAHRGDEVVDGGRVDRLDAVPLGHRAAFRHEVDAHDAPRAAAQRDAGRHLADRPEPEHDDRAARRDVRVLDRLPRRGDHVGEIEVALVRGPVVRHDHGSVLGLRDAQVLRLAAGDLAVELRVPEEGGALVLGADLRRLALGLQAALAHPAVPARDVERDDDAVADPEVPRLGADLLDHAHRLVTQDVARVEEHPEHAVQVQVGAADRGRRDAHDRVGGLLDPRVGHVLDAHLLASLPGQCSHGLPSFRRWSCVVRRAPGVVRRAQPLLPVVATPSTKCRWPRKKRRIIGSVVMTEAVTTTSHCDSPPGPNWSMSALRPRGIVNVDESCR